MASPNFQSRESVTPGQVVDLADGVRRIVAGNATPFTFTGTATYLVGTGEVAVIDPGPDDDEHLSALQEATRGERITDIVITHTHLDHTALVPKLVQATGATTWGFGPHGSGRPARLALTPAGEAGGDRIFAPDRRIGEGDVVEVAGRRLRARHTPGHCSNHLCFELEGAKALFSGDHVMGWSTTIVAPPDGHMGDYMDSLRSLLQGSHDVYWPGHGGPIVNPARYLRALISHRESREQAFMNRLRLGDRTIAAIVEAIYRDLDERLKRAAALTTLAHLVDLVERGEVEAEGPIGLDAVFRPAA